MLLLVYKYIWSNSYLKWSVCSDQCVAFSKTQQADPESGVWPDFSGLYTQPELILSTTSPGEWKGPMSHYVALIHSLTSSASVCHQHTVHCLCTETQVSCHLLFDILLNQKYIRTSRRLRQRERESLPILWLCTSPSVAVIRKSKGEQFKLFWAKKQRKNFQEKVHYIQRIKCYYQRLDWMFL